VINGIFVDRSVIVTSSLAPMESIPECQSVANPECRPTSNTADIPRQKNRPRVEETMAFRVDAALLKYFGYKSADIAGRRDRLVGAHQSPAARSQANISLAQNIGSESQPNLAWLNSKHDVWEGRALQEEH